MEPNGILKFSVKSLFFHRELLSTHKLMYLFRLLLIIYINLYAKPQRQYFFMTGLIQISPGVVAHVQEDECLDVHVCDSNTEIFVESHDEDNFLAIKGVGN